MAQTCFVPTHPASATGDLAKDLTTDFLRLRDCMASLDALFILLRNILSDSVKLRSLAIQPQLGVDVQTLINKWDQCHKVQFIDCNPNSHPLAYPNYQTFRNIMWRSREMAGGAQAIATGVHVPFCPVSTYIFIYSDFSQVCLPRLRDTEISLQAKILELRDYEQVCQEIRQIRSRLTE